MAPADGPVNFVTSTSDGLNIGDPVTGTAQPALSTNLCQGLPIADARRLIGET
jgi:hypothetical protein